MNGKQFIVILVITFIVGAIWLISDIIFNTKASIPISPELESALKPVNPNFNSRVLNLIKEVPDSNTINQTPASDQPSIRPTSTPRPSPRLIPTSPSPIATTGGQLTP